MADINGPTRTLPAAIGYIRSDIEFNVNGRLAISELSLPRRRGRLGVFVEDGKGAFSNITVTPLREPRTRWDW